MGIKSKRLVAAWDNEFLLKVLSFLCQSGIQISALPSFIRVVEFDFIFVEVFWFAYLHGRDVQDQPGFPVPCYIHPDHRNLPVDRRVRHQRK